MGKQMDRPILRATEEQLEKWEYWKRVLPPYQLGHKGKSMVLRDSGEEIPSWFPGRCNGYMIAQLDPERRAEWIRYVQLEVDPQFRIFSDRDIELLIKESQKHNLAKSAYPEEERLATATLLKRATMRTGCGRAILVSPYFPVEFNGKDEQYFCERCGRLDGINLNLASPTIQAIIEWRRQHMMEESNV